RVLAVEQIVAVGNVLVARVFGWETVGDVLKPAVARTRNVVGAIRILAANNRHRHRADIRTVARDLHLVEGRADELSETRIVRAGRTGMIRGAERCAHRGLISRTRPVTRRKGREGGRRRTGANPIQLPGSLIAAEEEQLVLFQRPADRAPELILLQDLLLAAPQGILEKAVGVQVFI